MTPLENPKVSLLQQINILRGEKMRPHVSTKSGSTQQKDLQFVVQDLQASSSDICSTNKDPIFLYKIFHRPILKGLRGEKSQNPNLIIVILCMGSY